MATSQSTASTESSPNPNSQPMVNQGPSLSFDSQSLQITQHRLNGQNFREWCQSVTLVIKRKGKYGYLSGDVVAPPETSANY